MQRSGKPMAAIIPVDVYERLIADREARFRVLERIRGQLPDLPDAEIVTDVAQAIAEVRADYAAGRSG